MYWGDTFDFQKEGREYYWRACEAIQHGRMKDAVFYQIRSAYYYRRARSLFDSVMLMKKVAEHIPPHEFSIHVAASRLSRSSSS